MTQDSPSALRERLILAGIDELNREGADNLSIRRVARRCGVSCAPHPTAIFRTKNR